MTYINCQKRYIVLNKKLTDLHVSHIPLGYKMTNYEYN